MGPPPVDNLPIEGVHCQNRHSFTHDTLMSMSDKNCLCCLYRTPVLIDSLLPWLDQYPDKSAALRLREGFTFGFKLGYSGSRKGREADNLKSAVGDPDTVIQKLSKEIKLGRIAGPFQDMPFSNLIISPVGLVPKSEPGKFRLIHNLSFPEGGSINDGIDRELCKVQYANFDDAVNLVVRVGKGALMAKADIESAFRLLPINPADFHLLGIKVDGQYYIDKALPMGASCSPAYFELFSTFLEWVVKKVGSFDLICHYMDDFFIVGGALDDKSHIPSCQTSVMNFESVCADLGVPLAANKSVGPSTSLVFLGLEIDSIRQIVSVPPDKLVKITDKVKTASEASSMTLRGLQSVIGSLSFICRAISPGRAFLRRLIDLTIGIKSPWRRIRMSPGAKGDLAMWLGFLKDFNGRAIFPEQFWREDRDLELYTDASGSMGCGGFYQGKWFQCKWPLNLSSSCRSIAWKEFFPILVSVVLWGDLLRGMRIVIRSDNESVVSIVNRQTSKCPSIMTLVRFFVLQCLKRNITFSARHIPGKDNNIADALSRFQVHRFRHLAPEADQAGAVVPDFLWRL